MRKLGLAAAVFVAALAGGSAWAQMEPKLPAVVCPRVLDAPIMDGNVDSAEWAAAGRLSDFMLLGGRSMPRLPTRVSVMHTKKALYIAAELNDDKPSELVANATERDGAVYEDDCLELFVDMEGTRQHYAHLAINSLGTKFDAYDHDAAENFDWNVIAAINAHGWAVEIELPFANDVPPRDGECWNLGVGRNAAREGELSTWGRNERGFHETQAFGTMQFVSPLLTASIDDLGDRLMGENLAMVTLHNLSSQAVETKLNVVVMGKDRRSHYFGVAKQTLKPLARQQVYIPYKVRRCGPAWLSLSLTDPKGVAAWRSGAYPIELPDVSDPLEATGHAIAQGWKAWAKLKPSEAKDTLKADLEELQKEWNYLDAQINVASGMRIARLQAMGIEVERLKARADALAERIEAIAS